MKFAECECFNCEVGIFKITFDNDIPHYTIYCPCCGSTNCKVTWIDRAGINKDMYDEMYTEEELDKSKTTNSEFLRKQE